MNREPTVPQIVDRILALKCGESCDVRLNPRLTRISNLKWLLSTCLQQFDTAIDFYEHPEGNDVILTIKVTATSRWAAHSPARLDQPIAQSPEQPGGIPANRAISVG
jgi:hypothetical protein